MRISDWSSDVCSSDLLGAGFEIAPEQDQGRDDARGFVIDVCRSRRQDARLEGRHHRVPPPVPVAEADARVLVPRTAPARVPAVLVEPLASSYQDFRLLGDLPIPPSLLLSDFLLVFYSFFF